MPQALVPIIQAIGAAVGTTVTAAAAGYIATGVLLLGSLALSGAQKRKAERQARAQYEASVVDRLINVQNPVASRELVLGRLRKGGPVFFQSSVAPHNAVYIATVALAAHEIDGVERIFFNETPIDLDANGNVTTAPWGRWNKISEKDTSAQPVRVLAHTPIPGSVFVSIAQSISIIRPGQQSLPFTLVGNTLTIEDYDPTQFYTVTYQWDQFISTARVFVHLGSPNQASDPRLQQLLPGTWTSEHRARGVAYLECEFVYEETSFPTGLPNITAQVRGAKCYDPRTGLTAFTENPAIMSRYVLMHPQFGKRTSLTADEEASIIAAANASDLSTSYTGTDNVQKYRAAIIVPFGAPARDVLDDLAQAMGGEWAFSGAEYVVRAGVYQAPVMHLTDADLAVIQRSNDGSASQVPIGISPHRPRNEKVNTISARIWDQAANYIETPLAPYRADALVAADGAELSQEVVMPAVFYAGQANHIAGIMLRDGRDPLTVTLPFKMRAYPLELFDGVYLTMSRYGWVGKEFRILNRTFHAEGFVMLTLKETTASIYEQGAPFIPGGSTSNSGLPKPWEINPPTITGIFSGEGELIVQNDGTIVNSVRVTWVPVQEASVESGGSIEVQFQVLPDGDWRTVSVPGDAVEARLTGVDDLSLVLIRARARNSLAESAWSPQQVHQVIGKTEPPPDIENLSISGSVLSWSLLRRVPDLAGYVFRFHYGNNVDWNSAAPLHTGLVTESPYELVTRPGGVVTIMGKAQDTSGNQSLATGNIVMNLGDPPIANVLEQWDFRAMGWPIGEDSGPLAPGRYAQYSIANIYSAERSTTATYVGPGGLIQTAGVNVPRFEAGELLVEDAATNLARWSDDQTNWTGLDTTVTANSTVAPDGTLTADTVTFANASAYRLIHNPAYSVAPGDKAIFSIYVKSSIRIARFGGAVPSGTDAYSIEDAGGGWYRQTVTRTFASAASFAMQYMIHAGMGLGVGSVAVWGAQGVVGGTVSSYIPTSSVAVTRAADVIHVSEGQYGYERIGGDLVALALDSFYGTDDQSFYGGDTEPFYEAGAYGQMVYVTSPVSISSALAGSVMTLVAQAQGTDLTIEYRLGGPGSFYEQDTDSFYGPDAVPFYGPPGSWLAWPGQVVAQNDVYQFRVTIGAGTERGVLESLILTVDAPDLEEVLANVEIDAGGTVIPYVKPFTAIKAITATLQANVSGAVTVETTKTPNLAPVIQAFNSAHVSVSGATADIILKGY